MEKKFYQDNFEQFLKESTENFKMYPSKRVWHSIYNDLHPGRRWPSLAILLLLISSVIFIGVSNSNRNTPSSTADGSAIATNNLTLPSGEGTTSSIVPQNLIADIETSTSAEQVRLQNNPAGLSNTITRTANPSGSNQNRRTVITNSVAESDNLVAAITGNNIKNNSSSTAPVTKDLNTELDKVFVVAGLEDEDNDNTSTKTGNTSTTETVIESAEIVLAKQPELAVEKKEAQTGKKNVNAEKEWIENYAFHNKPAASKWKSKVAYQLYMTPSVGYRILSKNTNFNPVYNSLVAAANTSQNYKDALSQAAAINFELGGNLLYKLSKNWNLKAGLQFNYTNYDIIAYELKHPTTTTVLLNDLSNGMTVLDPRATTLANSNGVSTTKLKNNTYQVSIPIGAEIKIAGNDNLKWYAGATIQPTYVLGGHSYLISSDLKNYVEDNSFMRKWNLNASVETFLSYKTKSGIIINAGPQFRYQVLSTNSRQYTYDEKLYNVGLKIGITTRF